MAQNMRTVCFYFFFRVPCFLLPSATMQCRMVG